MRGEGLRPACRVLASRDELDDGIGGELAANLLRDGTLWFLRLLHLAVQDWRGEADIYRVLWLPLGGVAQDFELRRFSGFDLFGHFLRRELPFGQGVLSVMNGRLSVLVRLVHEVPGPLLIDTVDFLLSINVRGVVPACTGG